ncbi:hypothetical protein EVAR_11548_1 [Eumeta japonica]|uniref:Uncharacterized protein n=1 Tax=Eumeta variegata TaxID=151549 RepID=A0A4C1TYT8_EUMVA|nr:hypothetical protein EVAR_11548_1 [Eumeta japonica]
MSIWFKSEDVDRWSNDAAATPRVPLQPATAGVRGGGGCVECLSVILFKRYFGDGGAAGVVAPSRGT